LLKFEGKKINGNWKVKPKVFEIVEKMGLVHCFVMGGRGGEAGKSH
jgi:hypothetical protein